MANLGTLWFGADVDLTALKKSIQEGNKDILNALKMSYDPKSFNEMLQNIQGALDNHTFNIKLGADGKSLQESVKGIEALGKTLGSGGNGGGIAPFDLKNIEGAAQGVAGMRAGIVDLSKQILDQKDKVHEWQNVVSKLREEWGKAVASGGRKSDAANAAYELYSGAREVLKQEREELFKLTQQRGRATVALREMILSEQLSQTESTTARQKYNAMLVETEKLLVRINDAIRNGGKTPLLDIAARDLSAFQTRAVLVDTKDVTAMSNLVSEFNRLSKVYGQVTSEAEKADKAYMKTVNDFTEQSKKAYAEREKAAKKASETEKKSASDASAEWTRLEAIIARLNVLRDNALKAKVPTDGVDGLINKMKQLQSLYSEISLNNGRLSNGMLFKDLKGSANTKSAMHEISQVYTETNQKIRESNQLTRESEKEAKAKASAVAAAEKQIQREIERSKKLYDNLTTSIDRGKKASRDMSALESQQSRLNGQMMLLKNMTAADKENASLVEKHVKGIQDVRTETERLKKAEDELTRARERANKRNDNAALKNLKDEEKSVRDAWNRYEELRLKIREVEALKQRGVALKMDVSEIDSALVRLKDLRWQMSDIINNGGRRSTGKKLLTSELWSDSGKRELLNANAEIKNFTANLRETEKESHQADAGIKRLGMAFNELKGYIKQNGGSDEMRRLQSELQGAIQKMRQLMNAGDYKGATSVFERVSGNIRQAQVATRLYESSLRGASSGVSQLTEQERQLASSLKGSSDAMKGQSQLLGDLKAMATQYLGVWGAQAFVRNIIEIGGQLEMQRLSIGAILGDMAKADDLFGKIKNLAVKSPFGVVELDQMTKQLSAYGFEYNELFDMTKRLADISAATGTDVSRLALALGHVRSEAALSGYTLRQFSMANIPLAKKLSEHLSEVEGKLVSIADVRKRVRNKEIGYQEVLDVLKELTDEGGMFYNAQEIMSESVKAKFKNLKDSMDIMYGELAESAVGGVLKDVAAMLTTLTRHWEELGGVLLAVAGYWTIHKVSMVALSRATIEGNIAMGQFTAAQLEAQAVTGNLTKQQLLRAVASGKMAVADAQAAASVLGLTTAQLQLVRRTGDVNRAMTMATLSTSKYSISQLRLIASMRSVNLGWLAQGMVGIANGAKAAVVAVKGLLASMWPMLALSAIAEVFFSIKREQEEFAESANYVGQSARQMMKDLDDAYNSVTKNGKPMDTEALREAVKTMRDVLEQNEFYTKEQQAQVTNAQSLSEKYDVLLQQMKDMREEAMFLANSEDLFKKIIENTGRQVISNAYDPLTKTYKTGKSLGFSFFNDSLTENMDEVNKANSKLQSSIQLLAEYQGVMEEAIKKNNNFGLSLDGKSWQEQIRLIAESGHWDEFVASVEGAGNRFEKTAANVKKASDDVRDKWDEVVNDDFEAIKLTLMQELNLTEEQFNDWAKNNEKALSWFADGIARVASKLGISQTLLDELKKRFLNFFNFASKGKPTAVQPTQYDLQSDLAKQIIGNIVRSNAKNGKIVYGGQLIKEINDLVGTGEHVKTVSEAVKAIKDRAQKDHDAMKDVEKIYGQTSKEYAAAKKKYEHSLEIAESNGISRSEIEKSKSTSEQEEKQAEKDAKQRAKIFEARMKEEEAQAKRLRELEDVMAELNVASIENKGKRKRAQEDLEHQKRIRQIQQQADEWKKESYKIAKEKWDAANTDKTKNFYDTEEGAAGWQGIGLTDEQYKIYIANMKKAEVERKRVLENRQKEDAQAMLDYLKEFGTIQERRYAIQKEYDTKIAEETRATQKMALEAEKKKALDALDIEVLKAEIDWSLMFEGLGSAFEEQMKEALEKVEKYIQSDAFKADDASNKAEIIKLRNELYSKVGSGYGLFDSELFKKIGDDMKALQDATLRYKYAQQQHTAAIEAQKQADEELAEAERKLKEAVTEEEKRHAEENLKAAKLKSKMAGTNATITGQQQKDANGNVIVAQGNLTRSYGKLQKQVDDFSSALGQVTSGSLTSFVTGIANMIDVIQGGNGKKGLVEAIDSLFGNIPSATAQIIAAILSIIDQIGEDSTKPITDLVDKLFSAVSKALEEAMNGDAAYKVMYSIGEGISKMISTIIQGIGNIFKDGGVFVQPVRQTFGGLFEGLFGGGNGDDVQNSIDSLTNRNELLQKSIEDLTDEMSKARGAAAVDIANTTKEYQEEYIKNLLDVARAEASYHGSHHSWDYYWNGFTEEELERVTKQMRARGLIADNASWNGDIWGMTPEQMKVLRENIDIWERMRQSGKGGYGDYVVKALSDYADQSGKLEEITNNLYETLTTTTADEMFDDFLSSLYDVADGSSDVMDNIAENWQKMVNRMVINNVIATKFQDWLSVDTIDSDGNKIESWYTRLAKLQDDFANNLISPEAYNESLDALMAEYNSHFDQAVDDVRELTDKGIIKSIKEAKKYFEDLFISWKSTLTDMSATADDWKNELIDQVLSDLVEKTILNVEFKVTTTELEKGEQTFADFAAYLDDWTRRYTDVLNGSYENEADRIAAINALIKEQTDVREQLAGKSKELAAGIGKDISESFSNALDNLGDTLLDTLLDAEKDAKQMGAEIGKTLVQEMLKEILASEKYAGQIAQIKQLWQNILKSENGWWEDTEGAFGPKGAVYTLDSVIAKITELNEVIADDTDIQKATDAWNKYDEALKQAESSFGDFHDDFMDAILDMEKGAENLKKKLRETLVKDLIDKTVFGAEIKDLEVTVGINQTETRTFENFDAYQKDWTTRYLAALEKGDKELMELLVKEMEEREAAMAKSAEEYAKSLQTATDDTFSGMGSDLMSALMDLDTTAEGWAKQLGEKMAQRLFEGMMTESKMLENLQEVFNAAVKAATDSETGRIDWKAVANNAELKTAVTDTETEFDEMRQAWEELCKAWGIEPEFTNSLDNLGDTLLDRLTSLDDDLEDIGKQFGETLMREMLAQMLETGPLAEKINDIRKVWQNVLTSDGGKWVDEEGLFGEAGADYTLDKVLEMIEALEKEMNDPQNGFTVLSDKIKAMKEATEDAKDSFADLTGTIVDGLRTSIDSSEDFVKSLRRQMTQQMVNAIIARKYADEMANLQEEWQWALDGEEGYTTEEVLKRVLGLIAKIRKEDEEVTALIDVLNELEEEADTTFSGMADSWAESLMGMKDTAEDWAQEVGRAIASKIVKEMVVPTLIKPLLDNLQKAMDAAFSKENATWQSVIDAALPYIGQITEAYGELAPIVEQIMNAFGIFREVEEEKVEYALGDLRSEFVSTLMDMEGTAKDWSKSISKILAQTFIDKFVLGDAFDAQMEAWQQQYENIMNSGMSEDERRRQVKQLRDAIAYAKEGYVEEARAIQELLGLNAKDDQNATANMADKITYDQADQLLGINMAQEMTLEQILATIRGGVMLGGTTPYLPNVSTEGLNQQILSALQNMANATQPVGNSSDIFNRLGYTNEYLMAIRDSNAEMLSQFGNVLGQINAKLSRL